VKLARLPRVAFAVLAIFLLSGCASIQAYQEESKHWQEMADRATEKLGGGQVSVSVVAGHVGNSGSCAAGTITLGHDGDTKWLLAHELGHHISGHCWEGIDSEMAANETAIKVLQVWGETEEEAYRHVANRLFWLAENRRRPLAGHNYCAELQDVARLYIDKYPPKDPGRATKVCPNLTIPRVGRAAQ